MLDIIRKIDKEVEEHLLASESKGRRMRSGEIYFLGKDSVVYSMLFDEEVVQDLRSFNCSVATINRTALITNNRLQLSIPIPKSLRSFINRFKSELKVISLDNPEFDISVEGKVTFNLHIDRTKLRVFQAVHSLDPKSTMEYIRKEQSLGFFKQLVKINRLTLSVVELEFLYEESGR